VFYLEIPVRMDLCHPVAQSALSGKEKNQITLYLLAIEKKIQKQNKILNINGPSLTTRKYCSKFLDWLSAEKIKQYSS
jgi:hypothetical protein